jgi:hypothetical protein
MDDIDVGVGDDYVVDDDDDVVDDDCGCMM